MFTNEIEDEGEAPKSLFYKITYKLIIYAHIVFYFSSKGK